MTADRWRQAKDLFDAALERPRVERAAFLDGACGGDAPLRQEVELLLAAHDDAGSFLDRPAVPPPDGAEPVPEDGGIGPYRVIRELGRGGMGVVYLAERADGAFEKRVAVKLVKLGMDTREIVRRFRAERQILAQLEHPNIARLLDGGNTESGAPYFVVEYVDGEPIDRYCDSRNLTVAERLRLFQAVCAAVQFAHQNLVVHRDLKPGNILVTAEGEVKLLDFGIAKLLDPQPSLRSLASTHLGSRPMTPEYSSPEQVAGRVITTATDVYALGLLLYELLTGHRAYRLESSTPQELEDVVCRRTPERPSTVALRGTPEDVRRRRERDPQSLSRRLSGDLDTIVLMALRKEPERRYASAQQLAEDVRRHLDGRPVMARPDTVWYRTGKFVRRHKLGAAAAVGALLLVLGFGVAMTIQQQRVARERNRAERNAERMERERDKARRTKDFLVELFEVSDPGEARGNSITARELLDRGAERIESELRDQPEVRADLMHTIGKVYRSLGLYGEARPLLEKTLELRRQTLGEESVDVAESLNELGWLLWEHGEYEASEQRYREALAMRRRLLGDEHADVAESLNGLALVLHLRGDYAGAESLFREALAMRRRLLGDEHPKVGESLNNLAQALKAQGDYAAAVRLYREALAIQRRVLGNEHPGVSAALNNLALALQAQGDLAGAEPLFREALAVNRRLHGDDHPDVARNLNNLAKLLQAQGDLAGAEARVREALAIYRQALGDEHPDVAACLHNLAKLLGDRGEHAEAEAMARESLAMFRELLGDGHPHVAIALDNLAALLLLQGQGEAAADYAAQALRIFEGALPPGHARTATARGVLGASLARAGRFAEAEPLLVDSYEALQGTPHAPGAAARLIDLYETWGKPALAARYRTPPSDGTP